MNKKLIALALVLLIAVGGVFAALPTPDSAVALLTGTIGTSFEHGFTVGTDKYQASATNPVDAFTTDPVLVYGFKAKNDTPFNAVMTVSSFYRDATGATEKVLIEKVIVSVPVSGGTDVTNITDVTDSKLINVLKYESSDVNKMVEREATITVIPASIADLPSGSYVSTLSIGIGTP